MEFKISDKIFIKKIKKLEQVFPEVCKYSCSKNDEVRNFVLIRDSHRVNFYKLHFDIFEGIKITCDNCGWSSRIPSSFAKKAFRRGLKSHLLIEYSKSKLISSWFLNFWGSLWRVWMISFALLIISTIFSFRQQAVLRGSPKNITFEEAFNGENLGKIVKIEGLVDYTGAISKEDYILKGQVRKFLGKEIYLPFFSKTKVSDFFVIKGGKDQINDVNARSEIRNYELLRNQEYTITGRVEKLEALDHPDLDKFFLSDLPREKKLNIPQIIINNSDMITLKNFILDFLPFYILILVLLSSSMGLQIYIDKKILSK